MITEYTFDRQIGWHPTPVPRLDSQAEHGDEALNQAGYWPMVHTHADMFGVGWIQVWRREEDTPVSWPRYACFLPQIEDESVVWMACLPDLWEFLRRYGTVGRTVTEMYPLDHEEPPLCQACAEARLQHQAAKPRRLTLVPKPPTDAQR